MDWLAVVAEKVITIIHVMALIAVAYGTVQAFVGSLRAMFRPAAAGHQFHKAYVQYARWLVAGLTFQLAGDIIETAFAPTWEDIGRLAAISVIRTFVNYFLERDMAAVEKREAELQRAAPAFCEKMPSPPTSPQDDHDPN